MVLYDYLCESCDFVFEVRHSIGEKPAVQCPKCGSSSTHKTPSLCAIVVGRSTDSKRREDGLRREKDMRTELARDYGVEKVAPLGGRTISDVYGDVKSRGGFVREEMRRVAEKSAAEKAIKRREWVAKANKRATPRRIEMQQRKAAEDYAKRRIVL